MECGGGGVGVIWYGVLGCVGVSDGVCGDGVCVIGCGGMGCVGCDWVSPCGGDGVCA